jgi:DNA-binding protein H-NS
MPRPTNLSTMSIDTLVKLREDINKILDRKANELRSQLSMIGGATDHPKSSLRGKTVPPKYRSPSGETWAGRGAKLQMVGGGDQERKEDRRFSD